jgi:hypothetical protein
MRICNMPSKQRRDAPGSILLCVRTEVIHRLTRLAFTTALAPRCSPTKRARAATWYPRRSHSHGTCRWSRSLCRSRPAPVSPDRRRAFSDQKRCVTPARIVRRSPYHGAADVYPGGMADHVNRIAGVQYIQTQSGPRSDAELWLLHHPWGTHRTREAQSLSAPLPCWQAGRCPLVPPRRAGAKWRAARSILPG